MKRISVHSEIVFAVSNLLMGLAVSMLTAADLGISMIVAPAYLVSEKLGFLTFGQSEYLVQALLFILFCVWMRKVKVLFFASFATCLLYGWILDVWRTVVPLFNPAVTPAGSMDWPLRMVLFVIGVPLTSFAVALSFHTYLYPQVYDFFVKGLTDRFPYDRAKFKTAFDATCFAVSLLLSFLFFGKIRGIGGGTVVMVLCNGWLIGRFSRWIETHWEIRPLFPKLERAFRL